MFFEDEDKKLVAQILKAQSDKAVKQKLDSVYGNL
jgi:hypothetical protein